MEPKLDNTTPPTLFLFLMKAKAPKLNSRQHRFVLNLFQGMSQTDAYISAGYNTADRNIASINASQLACNPKIAYELDRLRRKKEAIVSSVEVEPNINFALTKTEKRSMLADILRNGKPTTETHYKRQIEGRPGLTATMTRRDVILAIQEDNKMAGDYAPRRHEVAKKVLFDIRFTARKAITGGERAQITEGETIEGEDATP